MNIEAIYTWKSEVISIFLRYFLLASITYFIFYKWKNKQLFSNKIQTYIPDNQQVVFEVSYSIITLCIFSFLSYCMFQLYHFGFTKIYLDISEFGIGYFIFSIFLSIIIHDAYFYWTHRWLHSFRWTQKIHAIHHQSISPTPWASFSFHPIEAVINFGIIPIIILAFPIHPIALSLFLLIMTLINVMGHLGFETFSSKFIQSKLGQFQNNSTNHDFHHEKYHSNFGLYFTFWDKWMKTFYNPKSIKTNKMDIL